MRQITRPTASPPDINAYIRETTGQEFTAKDFRTWNATVLMAQTLGLLWHDETRTDRSAAVLRKAYVIVADYLGNTPAVARQSYVDARLIDLFNDGTVIPKAILPDHAQELPIHAQVERAVLEMLQNPRRAHCLNGSPVSGS